MPSVLLATCAEVPAGDEDAGSLEAALRQLDVDARWAVWSDPDVDWDGSLVVLRSTWDYTLQLPNFLDWVEGLSRVANAADVVAWNTDKTYLRDLVAAGVPTVPTAVVVPGDPIEVPDTEFVVKPSVGAGSRGVGRFAPDRVHEAQQHADALHRAGRTVLVQPYLSQVDTAGETALVYFDGRFSHAIRKAPMLATGTAYALAMPDLYVEERVEARAPSAAERSVGEAALALVRERFGADQLYTRVDLLPTADGPVVIELELVEPSLFLGYGDIAASSGRFATAIAART